MTDTFVNPNGRPLRHLSDRQFEAIEWLAAGHRPEEVASIMHVPPLLIMKWLRSDLMFRGALTIRNSDPQPPRVDLFKSLERRLHLIEPEQPWAEETTKE